MRWRVGAHLRILEVHRMEWFLFIVFVAACGLLLFRATKQSKKKVNLEHERKLKERKARAELLETPAIYTLARPDQPWHTRRKLDTSGGSRPEPFKPRFESNDPHYDGYSRRDRHHIADVEVVIEDEPRPEDTAGHKDESRGRKGLSK